jgi:hypothetical protein
MRGCRLGAPPTLRRRPSVGVMKSGRISTAIGLAVGAGPAIVAHFMPRIAMLDKLGAVILGLGQAAIQTYSCDAVKAPARIVGRVVTGPRRAATTLSRSDLLAGRFILFDLPHRFVASDAEALLDFTDKLNALTGNTVPAAGCQILPPAARERSASPRSSVTTARFKVLWCNFPAMRCAWKPTYSERSWTKLSDVDTRSAHGAHHG